MKCATTVILVGAGFKPALFRQSGNGQRLSHWLSVQKTFLIRGLFRDVLNKREDGFKTRSYKRQTLTLSISRVMPMRAATRRQIGPSAFDLNLT
jgi:hypothetical protein